MTFLFQSVRKKLCSFDFVSGDWDIVVQNLVKSLNASIMSIPVNNIYRVYITATEDMGIEVEQLLKVLLRILLSYPPEMPL